MSFSKFDVKPFKFGQLVPNADQEAVSELEEVSSFEMKSLKDASAFKNSISEDVIRMERGFAKAKSFSINPLHLDKVLQFYRNQDFYYLKC